MKEGSPEYELKEEEIKQKPVELYHIWHGDGDQLGTNVWYYTTGDVMVSFDKGDGKGEQNYLPATLKRSLVQYDTTLEVTKMTLQVAFVEDPVLEFIGTNPIEILWISVMRLHRDLVPLEASVVFIGQIKNVSFQGIQASAECVGFEFFLSMPIPLYRYQLTCNWILFDDHCGVIKTGGTPEYKVTTAVTFTDPTILRSSALVDSFGDGYFIFGTVEFRDECRTIIDHVGNQITLNYKMRDLESGDTIDVYPGCDRRNTTCKAKFDNLINFLGFPFIPEENPALRGT